MAKATKAKKEVVLDEVITQHEVQPLETTLEIETVEEPTPIVEEVVEVKSDPLVIEPIEILSEDTMEEKIVKFIDSKGEGEHKLNDFLKSLFPIPKFNEPAQYIRQENSRYLRHLLDNMQSEGKISIVNNLHQRLGEHWYEEGTGIAQRHNLNTVKIVAKK